jgi:hypothetical protein
MQGAKYSFPTADATNVLAFCNAKKEEGRRLQVIGLR